MSLRDVMKADFRRMNQALPLTFAIEGSTATYSCTQVRMDAKAQLETYGVLDDSTIGVVVSADDIAMSDVPAGTPCTVNGVRYRVNSATSNDLVSLSLILKRSTK